MLTYDAIRRLLELEKSTEKLVRLPEGFFSEVRAYLQKKTEAEKERWEIESAKELVKSLLMIREGKLLRLARDSVRLGLKPENLLEEEKEFFDEIARAVRKWQEKREGIFQDGGKVMVVLQKDFPDFVGPDLKVYGPFKVGDVANLPAENANILIEKGIAKKI
ncbi:MAG: hypothetical protein DRP12_03215 [Candidatus Aenigmatarchaeota archaeon]|nr:MAG: hypothetical protein DRP12_03215 [Candidatus Aenigmarchaeota archaeon]